MTVTAALQGWSDAELGAASLSGDRQAFDELVCRYRADADLSKRSGAARVKSRSPRSFKPSSPVARRG
jgi:hypothetical protein